MSAAKRKDVPAGADLIDEPSLAEYAALGSAAARMTPAERGSAMGHAGIRCLKCGCGHTEVDATRHTKNGIRRYRVCRHCGYRMGTTERAGS